MGALVYVSAHPRPARKKYCNACTHTTFLSACFNIELGGEGGGQDIVYKLLSCSCVQLRCNISSSHRLEASFASRLLVILVGRAARFLQYCWHGVEFHSSDPRRDKAYQQPRCSGPVSVRHCGPSRAQQGHHIPVYESLEAETREGVQTEVGMAPRFDEAAD